MYQINLYIETSIRGLKKTDGWYAYVLEWLDSKEEIHTVSDFRYEEEVTPNMLALLAFCAALNRITKDSDITVFTDSLYLRSSFTRYLPAWKENGWKTAHGSPIKNMLLWQQALEKTKNHKIIFSPEYHHSYKNWMVSEMARRKMHKC